MNVRELIRFELEGLSLALPPGKQIVAFDVTMEPLPRVPTGAPDRDEIARRWRTGRLRDFDGRGAASPIDDHVRRVVALVQSRLGPDPPVRPSSNLELDLGLDSIQRLELMTALEDRFGKRIPEEVVRCIFLVRDAAEAFRGCEERSHASEPPAISLDAIDRRNLLPLLRHRTGTAIALFCLLRPAARVFVKASVEGLHHVPRHGPFIIAPNHQSYIDPLVLMGVLPFAILRNLFFVGAAEYFETPVKAWLARMLNIVPVDPDTNLLPALQAGAFGLKHGKVLVVFPEGERSIDGRVRRFRKGAAILSQHLAVPIVPVAIRGLFEVWPRRRPLDWKRLLPWSGHRCTIRFGAPIPPAPARSYDDHINDVRAAVESLWDR